jgi:hypothetical protein
MELLPEAAGPQDPLATTSPRRPGSVRRTTSIDTRRPDGLWADAVVDARGRDLRTNADGTTDVMAEAHLLARVSPGRELLELQTVPAARDLDQLIGASVGPGFRSRMAALVTAGCGFEEGSLLYLLLDDLTGATLVSGYALVRGDALGPPPGNGPVADGDQLISQPEPQLDPERKVEGETRIAAGTGETTPVSLRAPRRGGAPLPSAPLLPPPPHLSAQGDICAGWAHDATMMLHLADTGLLPVPLGPPAPILEPEDDPLAWHAMAPLGPHAVRRRRRLDLVGAIDPADDHEVDMHFRDSHVDDAGLETIMHEYTLTGTVNPAAGRVGTVSAQVRVLPWMECPAALASAQRIDGMELAQLRLRVRKEFVGRTTCTHLNDSLRSLADVTALSQELEPNAVA